MNQDRVEEYRVTGIHLHVDTIIRGSIVLDTVVGSVHAALKSFSAIVEFQLITSHSG